MKGCNREYERGLQLYYNRARYYNPLLSRFISRDPIDISDDVNLYSYVGNNPVMFVDPMGLAKSMTADEFRVAFVDAYDDYLLLEKKLDHLNIKYEKAMYRSWDFDYLKKLRKERDDVYNKFKAQEELAREMHYSRNEYNNVTVTGIQDAVNSGWIEPDLFGSTILANAFHQELEKKGIERKFISGDGHNEVLYYSNGIQVTDRKYYGTYNIYSPINDKDLHKEYDVKPYLRWGN